MNKTIKLGLILLAFTAVAAAILGFLNQSTKDIIADVKVKASNEARKEVLPEGSEFRELDKSEFEKATGGSEAVEEIYEGLDNGNVVGYTIKTVISGYSGPIVVMTGIDTEGIISGMKVVSNTETPGLGAIASKPEFQDQYKEKQAKGEIAVVKSAPTDTQIQALTGATITSKAVTKGVNDAIAAYENLAK